MKSLKLILLLALAPLSIFGQSLSGLWTGILTNDSTSVRQDQSFEIILSQYKEKVMGYSRSTFIVNDTLYYIVKRVKGTINGDVCEVKDDHVVSHNFPRKPDKGVKVISTFRRNKQDSSWYLEGDWKTTQTKKYYTVSGKVDLKEEKDLTTSKLFPHLEELGLDKEMPQFAATKKTEAAPVKEKRKEDIAKTVAPKPVKSKEKIETKNKDVAIKNTPVKQEPIAKTEVLTVAVTLPEEKNSNPKNDVASVVGKSIPVKQEEKNDKPVAAIVSNASPAIVENKNLPSNKPVITETKEEPKPSLAVTKPVVQQPAATKPNEPVIAKTQPLPKETPAKQQPAEKKPVAVVTEKPAEDKRIISATPTSDVASVKGIITQEKNSMSDLPKVAPIINTSGVAALVSQRKTEAPQFVNYVSDSLVLILYDNGEVDGDTVSVLLNGQMFMEKQGLKTAAIKKTIYITPGNEELTLVLFAENLGKYPPNTGLLVVYDGEDRHQLRFSADFQKNASVVFRRKK